MALRYNIKQAVDKPKGVRVLVPVIQPSPGFERSYLALLRRVLHGAAGGVRDIIIPSYERQLLNRRLTGDADEDAFNLFTTLLKSLQTTAVSQLAELLGLESKRHTEQWLKNAKKAFGIDLKGVVQQEDLSAYLEAAALRNASLIKGLTDDLTKKVSQDTLNALIAGDSVAALKERIKHSLNTSDSRAQLIAQDQTSKLNADLNKKRHQEAGIDSYIWRTSHDERVRPRHAALEGNKYKYDEPTGAEDGLPPGQPIRCRCIAQAVVDFGVDDKPKTTQQTSASVEAVAEPVKKPMSQAQKAALAKAQAASAAKKAEATAAAKAAALAKAQKEAEEAAAAAAAAKKLAEEAAKKALQLEILARARAARAKALAAQKAAAKQVPKRPPFAPTKKSYVELAKDFPVTATVGNGKGSLTDYVGNGYRGMNEYLRSDGSFAQAYKDRAIALKAAVERSTIPVDIRAWRGVGSIKDMVPGTTDVSKLLGATIEDKGFMSVATKKQVSENFALGNNRSPPPPPLMIEVRLRAGQKGLHVGRHDLRYDETEIILPPGSKFRVVEATPKGFKREGFGQNELDHVVLELIE